MTGLRARAPRARELRLPPALMRLGAGQLGRRVLDPDLPFQAQRQRLDRIARSSPLPRGTTVTRRELGGVPAEVVAARGVPAAVAAAGGVPAEAVAAGGARAERTVVHFHGGGYCVGSARTARAWAAHLSAAAACPVVVAEYRLAPEHPHPAALDDARAVMRALLDDAAPGSVVVSGDSAGGGLALALVLARRDAGQELPAGCILLSPWLDLGADRYSIPGPAGRDVLLRPRWLQACATAYADPSRWADPSVSPVLAAPAGLPPLLIQAGSDELLAPDAERLAASASAAGVDVTYTRWPRMWHDFALQPGLLAAADSALAQAAWFVAAVTGA